MCAQDTALHLVAEPETALVLLCFGADPDAIDKVGVFLPTYAIFSRYMVSWNSAGWIRIREICLKGEQESQA